MNSIVVVRWYPPGSLTIDNSEPWNNRILLSRKDTKTGASGIDVETGDRVWQGSHIDPVRQDRLNLRNPESCMPGSSGDHVAIVHCVGCSQGVDFLNAAADYLAGSTLNLLTAPMRIGKLVDAAQTAAASQNISKKAALEAVVADRAGGLRFGEALPRGVPVHDISDLSDLPNFKNLVYFGTPRNLWMQGTIARPSARKGGKKPAPHIAWRYQVKIDCKHFHPNITNTGTENSITVDFYAQGEVLQEVVRDGKDIDCGLRWEVWSANGYADGVNFPPFDKVVISTSGRDGFFIDQVDIRQIALRGGSSS